jgi:hypothetical protein
MYAILEVCISIPLRRRGMGMGMGGLGSERSVGMSGSTAAASGVDLELDC